MRTDDFLADLEVQLRDARPRRDLRPAASAVLVIALAIAALAIVPRGLHSGQPAAPNGPSVAIVNASGDRALAGRARAWLRQRGYDVVSTTRSGTRAYETRVTPPAPRFHAAARRLAVAMGSASFGDDPGSWTAYAPLQSEAQLVMVLGDDQRPMTVQVSGANDAYARMIGWLRSHGIEVSGGATGPTPERTTLRVGYFERPYVERVVRALPVRPDIVYTKDWRGLRVEVGRNDPMGSPNAEPGPGLTAQIVSPVPDRELEDKLVVALQAKGYLVATTIHREPLAQQDSSIIIGSGSEGEEAADALRKSLGDLLQDPRGPEEGYLLPRTSFPDSQVLIWLGERDLTPPEIADIVDESGGHARAAERYLSAHGVEVGSVRGGHGRSIARTEILWPRGREQFAKHVAQTLGVDARLFPSDGLHTTVHLGTDARF
jgi:hypothetical protein